MEIDMPLGLDSYFRAANADDIAGIVAHFAPNARVRDEGEWRQGSAQIEHWARDTRARYRFTATPLSARQDGAAWIVTVRVEGTFPGSPIELRYRFELEGRRISRLEIV